MYNIEELQKEHIDNLAPGYSGDALVERRGNFPLPTMDQLLECLEV